MDREGGLPNTLNMLFLNTLFFLVSSTKWTCNYAVKVKASSISNLLQPHLCRIASLHTFNLWISISLIFNFYFAVIFFIFTSLGIYWAILGPQISYSVPYHVEMCVVTTMKIPWILENATLNTTSKNNHNTRL